MITIFSIPKAFTGISAIIQQNAINSWLQLGNDVEVILMGDDPGVEDISKKLNIKYIPDIKKNKFNTPLLDDAFKKAQQYAKNNYILYSNADIILFPDLINILHKINLDNFLICGRRIDLDVKEIIDMSQKEWTIDLRSKAKKYGLLHGYSGIDYFLFPKNQIQLPAFAVGRPGWDNWLIYEMRRRNIPVLDATSAITVIHQNHDYNHSPFAHKKQIKGPEMDHNITLAGGRKNLLTLRESNFILTNKGIEELNFAKKLYSKCALWYPVRALKALKRYLNDNKENIMPRLSKK